LKNKEHDLQEQLSQTNVRVGEQFEKPSNLRMQKKLQKKLCYYYSLP
tara:strand:- start:304 stop:444 length:141 start_codon:yes stop_codon:yes gene_type:complete